MTFAGSCGSEAFPGTAPRLIALKLNEWSAVAEIVSAAAVTVSLIFVGMQIKDNTVASKAATFQSSVGYDIAILNTIGASPDNARVFLTYRDDPDSLENDELSQGQMLFTSTLRHLENIYLQHEAGMLSDEGWSTRGQFLRNIVRTRGFAKFVNGPNARNFSGNFIDYAKRIRAEAEPDLGD